MFMLVSGDDILVFTDKEQRIDFVVGQPNEKFELRIKRKIEKFLGFTFDDNGDTNNIHNTRMVDHFLRNFRMTECKEAKSLLSSGTDFSRDESDELRDAAYYRKLNGSLLHL